MSKQGYIGLLPLGEKVKHDETTQTLEPCASRLIVDSRDYTLAQHSRSAYVHVVIVLL